MTHRKPRRRPAYRPRLLTPEVESRLLDATRLGSPVIVAAGIAGIGRTTFLAWLARGRDEMECRDDGQEPDEGEQPYVDLLLGVQHARDMAQLRALGNIQKVAAGGFVTETTTRSYRDAATGRVVEEVTEKRAVPDWRASAWYLERQHRDQWGKEAQQVDLTISGPGGAPLQVEHVDAEALADRLAATLAPVALAPVYQPGLPSGDDEDQDDEE
jgi:hypothetical protein